MMISPSQTLVAALAALASCASPASARLNSRADGDPFNPAGSCSATRSRIDGAVAWGFSSQAVLYGDPLDLNYLYTVSANSSASVPADVALVARPGRSLPDNASDSSFCFIDIPLSLTSVYNAQADGGNCSTVVDERCMLNLTAAAWKRTGNSSNFDPVDVCSQAAAAAAQAALPSRDGVCGTTFSPDAVRNTVSTLLNGNNASRCTFNSSDLLPGWTVLAAENVQDTSLRNFVASSRSTDNYDAAVHDVRALITLLIPNKNVDAVPGWAFRPTLSCARANMTRNNAPAVSALPSPPAEAVPSPSSTSDAPSLPAPEFSVMVCGSLIALLTTMILVGNQVW